jgi:hypothetical protein
MSTATGTLSGTVVDEGGTPISGATLTLIGTGAPQVQRADAQGLFTFTAVAVGNYRLSAVADDHRPTTVSNIAISPGQNTETTVAMAAATDPPQTADEGENSSPAQSTGKFANWLAAGQLIVMAVIGGIFVFSLIVGVTGNDGLNMVRLKDEETARGVITYLVAVATVAIATILVMAAIMSDGKNGIEKRFAQGKEVLTLLIGVLGTIIGFYYGSTTRAAAASQTTTPASVIQIAPVKVTPESPVIGAPLNISGQVSGGIPPYTYDIKFDPTVIPTDRFPPVADQPSSDGKISHDLTIPAEAPEGEVIFTIVVKDKNGTVKEHPQKITLKKP